VISFLFDLHFTIPCGPHVQQPPSIPPPFPLTSASCTCFPWLFSFQICFLVTFLQSPPPPSLKSASMQSILHPFSFTASPPGSCACFPSTGVLPPGQPIFLFVCQPQFHYFFGPFFSKVFRLVPPPFPPQSILPIKLSLFTPRLFLTRYPRGSGLIGHNFTSIPHWRNSVIYSTFAAPPHPYAPQLVLINTFHPPPLDVPSRYVLGFYSPDDILPSLPIRT